MVMTFSSYITRLPTYSFSSILLIFLSWNLYCLGATLLQWIDNHPHLIRKTPMEQHEYRHESFLPSNLFVEKQQMVQSYFQLQSSSSSIQLLQIWVIRIGKGNVILCFFDWLSLTMHIVLNNWKHMQNYWSFVIKTCIMWNTWL